MGNRNEYRVEYRAKFGDNIKWSPRSGTHATIQAAFNELAIFKDSRNYYDFRIVKRTVTAWEEVE